MTTDQRIENLEKGLASARRFNRCLLAAVGLGLGVWFLAGTFGPTMAAAPAGDVRAKCFIADRFIVEDPTGIPRAILSADTTGPYLSLFDEKGNSRAQLSLLKGVPGLNLWDENNKFRAVLGVNKDGPTLNLWDENGKDRVRLIAQKNGALVLLNDENEKARVLLTVLGDVPTLTLFDGKGTVTWKAP